MFKLLYQLYKSGLDICTTQHLRKGSVALLLHLMPMLLFSQQPGSLDTTFNPTDTGFAVDLFGADECMVLQSDGKVIVASRKIIRLNADGTLDPGFYTSPNLMPGEVLSMQLLPNGKLLIGGSFTNLYGSGKNYLVRLNPDGTIDNSFQIGTGFDSPVTSIAVQPDGKIITGGGFQLFNGLTCGSIVRLHPDGAPDTTYVTIPLSGQALPLGIPNIFDIGIQPDGKVIAGGYFYYTKSNGNNIYNLIRYNTDGSTDTTFVKGAGTQEVNSIQIQSDGKVLIAGNVIVYDGISVPRGVMRLHADGQLDTTFAAATIGINSGGEINQILLQSDGKIMAIGNFLSYNGVNRKGIFRLLQDGTIDPGFSPGTGFYGGLPNQMVIQPDSNIIVVGSFTSYNTHGIKRIIRLFPDGSIDDQFFRTSGFNDIVRVVTRLPSNKILAGGHFSAFNNSATFASVVINENGTIDTSYKQLDPIIGPVSSQSIQDDGKFIVGGQTLSAPWGVRRLLPTGHTDSTFTITNPLAGFPVTVAIQADQKVLYNSGSGSLIRRLPNGVLDSAFGFGNLTNDWIFSILLQPDQRIIIGGRFTTVNTSSCNRITRLLPDRTVDSTFHTGTGFSGANDEIKCIAIQDDGKIVVGGRFSSYNGNVRSNIVRLNADGSYDSGFLVGTGIQGLSVNAILIQPDGKIVVSGNFSFYNTTVSVKGILRLNSNGTLDNSFITGTGFVSPAYPWSLAFTDDWKIIAGGSFTSYNGTGRNFIARIHANNNSCNTPPSGIQTNNSGNIICPGDSITLYRVGGALPNGGTYRWYSGSCGGILIGTGDSVTVAPTTTTLYALRAESPCGNSVCVIKTVNVVSVQPVISGPVALCDGDTATLLATGNYSSWQWSNGSSTPSVQIAAAGIYTVTVTDAVSSCIGAATIHVLGGTAHLVEIFGDSVVCNNTNSVLDAGNYSSYIWSTGNISQSISVTNSGTYIVTVTDLYGCTGSDQIQVSVLPAPVATISAFGSTSICQGDSVLLSVNPGFSSWQWFRGITSVPVGSTENLYAKNRGPYYCVASDSSGCSDTTNTITIYVPCISVDPAQSKSVVSENTMPRFKIHPNPALDGFYIVSDCEATIKQFVLSNSHGQNVKGTLTRQSEFVYRLEALSPGIYFLQLGCHERVEHFKIVQL